MPLPKMMKLANHANQMINRIYQLLECVGVENDSKQQSHELEHSGDHRQTDNNTSRIKSLSVNRGSC